MTQIVGVLNLALLVMAILGPCLLVFAFFAHRYVDRHRDPKWLLAHTIHRLVGQTLGQPLIDALRVSEGALLDQARQLTPEQRAAATNWAQHRRTRLTTRQRDQILAALHAVAPKGVN